MKRQVSKWKTIWTIAATVAFCILPIWGQAQTSREHIRSYISAKGECKSVAITRTGGDLMLYGRNGYASKNLPTSLTSELKELNNNNKTIVDVVLTEDRSWAVLFGDNGATWLGAPTSLVDKHREFNQNGYTITSVAFNDDGDWVVVSEEKYAASSTAILYWLQEGAEKYGQLWTVHMSNDAIVAVYERGGNQ